MPDDFIIRNFNGEVAFRFRMTDELFAIEVVKLPPPQKFYADHDTARKLWDWLCKQKILTI